ncbi:carbohydrate ABC transporter permease [uncultured Enterovirga sp.]|uniref:carbohydrate ABC transporter permease n=1 Tax=uncultured Enterovirga sp. TaxID=2026352 RepID=UPI0035CC63CC
MGSSTLPLVPPTGTRSRGWRPRGENYKGYLFVAPAVLLLVLFAAYPLASTLWLSLHDVEVFSAAPEFSGLANYRRLFSSAGFWEGLVNGLVFSFFTVVLQLLVGIATALLLNNAFRGRALVRGLILFPFVAPTIVAVLIWKWILNDLYGVANLALMEFGIIKESIAWLGSPEFAMPSVVLINVWMFFPFITIQVLARLQVIPGDLYEAARIDGAGPLQRFWYVTLPELRSTILLVVFIRGLWMFNKFDTIWLLTQGGPVGKTATLPILAYMQAFQEYQLGAGAATSACIFMLLALFGVWYARKLKQEDGR